MGLGGAGAGEGAKNREEEERERDSVAHPPTGSLKAFEVLGGPRITRENRKGVERLTGIRNSQVGLALTTDDLPTRRIVPDNARLSLFSLTSNSTDRSTLYSSIGSEPGGAPRERMISGLSARMEGGSVLEVPEEEEERYDPREEDGEAASIYREAPSLHGSAAGKKGKSKEDKPPVPPRTTTAHHSASNSASTGTSAKTARPSSSPNSHPLPPSPHKPPLPTSHPSLATKPSTHSLAAPIPPSLAPTPPRGSLSNPNPTPLASAYIVAGLPKDPSTWSFADLDRDRGKDGGGGGAGGRPDHAMNAVPRFWRAEVLGCTISGDQEGVGVEDEGRKGKGRKREKKRSKEKEKLGEEKDIEGPFVRLGREEVQRIQGKAVKLAFNRELEILASTTQPASTISQFQFSIPISPTSTSTSSGGSKKPFSSSTAVAWDLSLGQSSLPTSSTAAAAEAQQQQTLTKTYYASTLLVYSHADGPRSTAIRSALSDPKSSAAARLQAAKAAKAGRKLGEKLERQLRSPLGAVVGDGVGWNIEGGGGVSETEGETEGFVTESEWGDASSVAGQASAALAHLTPSTPFWLPYALILVSEAPVYNLLTDILRISWARYHQDIASHSLQMQRVLHFPAPRVGEKIKLPVSVSTARDTYFVATMPGKMDWSVGAEEVNFAMWPVFKALHADNLLTIAEIALSPLGRVLFVSRHSIMLGLAVSTFQHILELRGWRGITHSTVHARDLKLFVEDPGPWLIGIPILSRSIALSSLPPEVAIVDLDTNSVTCSRVFPGARSTGSAREKARKKLEAAIGSVGSFWGVPSEITEAFPSGRFRPFSEVEVAGVPKEAERLRPADSWDWDQSRLIKTFDSILASQPRKGLARFLPTKKARRISELDPSAKHVQHLVRKHADTFVDRRDLLESKINRLNTKLASLVAESNEWQKSFDVFKEFSDKLTKESAQLKTRLEKERREARRLTGQVSFEKERQARLEASLNATEKAREQALLELSNVQHVRHKMEEQRAMLMGEMQAILAGDDGSPLYESVYLRIEALSQRSDTSSRPEEEAALAPLEEEEEEEMLHTQSTAPHATEEERLELMRQAAQETLRSIQSRLSIVLQNAGQLEITLEIPRNESSASSRRPESRSQSISAEEGLVSVDARRSHRQNLSPVPAPTLPLPDTPPSSVASPSQAEMDDSFTTAADSSFVTRPHHPRRFQPKPFQLTPPVSPELSTTSPPPFVTTERGGGRRPHGHRVNDSVASSTFTAEESVSTPTTATPEHQYGMVRSKSAASSDFHLTHQPSSNSFGQHDVGRFATPSRASDYDWDDSQSFASASEGLGASRPGSSAASFHSEADYEAQGEGGEQTERVGGGGRASSSLSSYREDPRFHQQQDDDSTFHSRPSFSHHRNASTTSAVDSPPIELFTRAMSPNGGRRRNGSVDLRSGRLPPERFAPWRAGGAPASSSTTSGGRPNSAGTVKTVRRT
ncbi:hypothetical protein BCR35DRAFT_354095 [Leucosporidium creatinivorum]|uniref:cDENN domain-containing protein n=1 Tax=Leucosporidium creatinivorum TaxID=106004 RepID=A0A1Y2ERE2_9BASI|nr:hypothetical protein BCR35DRAFT_354095 [Leucosporidium creatinivorum]